MFLPPLPKRWVGEQKEKFHEAKNLSKDHGHEEERVRETQTGPSAQGDITSVAQQSEWMATGLLQMQRLVKVQKGNLMDITFQELGRSPAGIQVSGETSVDHDGGESVSTTVPIQDPKHSHLIR